MDTRHKPLSAVSAYFILGGILMKKTLISALTAALVAGAASTTFAAANPFSDVPADHWAYDAVTQLAKDGVVEGYGDSTYRGEQSITRYEMAQIVAKAMAKEDISKADKALVDKLAAEFSDELNNLGVRVANLEKKTDNVKWTGEARYTYQSNRTEGSAKSNANEFLFRVTPTAAINEHWTANARIDYYTDMNNSKNAVGGIGNGGADDANVYLDRAYAEGTYGKTVIDFGKFPVYTEQGLVLDEQVSGARIDFTTGKLNTEIVAGRFSFDSNSQVRKSYAPLTGSYQAIHFTYKANKAFSFAAGYDRMNAKDLYQLMAGTDTASIWELGATYNFNDALRLSGAYAKDTQGNVDGKYQKAYNIELGYKAADPANKGSFGIYAAYRYLGDLAVFVPTYDGAGRGQKGWEFGAQYTFAKNILGTVRYFTGKDIMTDGNNSKLFGRVEFFF